MERTSRSYFHHYAVFDDRIISSLCGEDANERSGHHCCVCRTRGVKQRDPCALFFEKQFVELERLSPLELW